ncbi:retinol-binding protein pinta-like [Thrips palmi]|uniref:Retinol-binding protein pinta-like n=1 Tax=Thrips palmi TaxID=161013 RepID=A0A6P8YYW9_THRPL|nr:retinol-binding protein pinta-like [Thrips palmi]
MMKLATVEREFRKNPQLKQEDIDAFQEWAAAQPHLPAVTVMSLVIFLHCSFYDLETAKKTLTKYYVLHYSSPHIFMNRDPLNEELAAIAKAVGIVILDGLDNDGNLVVFQRLIDTNPAKYNMDLTLKLSHMMCDIWQLENGTAKGTVLVYDQRGFGLSHMASASLSSMRNMMSYVQECAPINVVAIHVIYTNAVIDTILALFKPFMRSSLYKLIKTYREAKLDEFYESVPQEILPEEYGGKQPSLEELSERSYQKFIEYRDHFLEQDRKVSEAAALAKSKSPGLLGRVGAWIGFGE